MIKFLIKRFVPDFLQVTKKEVRERYGVLAGILGIICNIFLFLVKLIIGFLMNSIAIISDAFNNLSDMGSSVVTIIGLKMSNMHADKEHPFGHGRIEYISSLIVSFIIMLVGFELLKSSVGKIINPEKPELNLILIIILCLSVLVKVWMFSYNRYIGKQINSGVIKASATDSLNDVISTGAVIISAIISGFVSFPIDAIAGSAVSVLVMYSGFSIAKETISILLGNPPDPELVAEINERILSQNGIVGTHDLIVHDYGPGRVMASVHAEVPDDIDIVKIHEIIDLAEKGIARDLGVHIVIHMDPITVNCERTDAIKSMLVDLVKGIDARYNIHDFRMTDGESNINLIFDLEVPCGYSHQQKDEIVKTIRKKLSELDTRYKAVIEVDDVF
ncbi:MAG: cation transporter [Clostridia bacterium]|nr:cation transporter [Clostridia bacterium]